MKLHTAKSMGVLVVLTWIILQGGSVIAAEMRVWTSVDGQIVEAKYVKHQGADKIIIERKNGKRVVVPLDKLCQSDKDYAGKLVVPDLEVEFSKKTSTRTHNYDDTLVALDCSVDIKAKSSLPYGGQLTVEAFVIGENLSNGNLEMLTTKTWKNVSAPQKRGNVVQLNLDTIQLDYDDEGTTYGTKFWGFAVFVLDDEGGVLAVDTSRKKLNGGLQLLRTNELKSFQ